MPSKVNMTTFMAPGVTKGIHPALLQCGCVHADGDDCLQAGLLAAFNACGQD